MKSNAWWKEAVVYQIYPRSFRDSNGDGMGDLRGIIEKLDYLQELGVDVIWLSPIYDSPNDDNGYDIRDYRRILEDFGTMADFDELLAGLHARGMKVMMDLVVNHTSDEHEWFQKSRESKDSPYRDYYYWRPAKNGKEPNNWESFFSGSTWKYDEQTAAYYLHLFSEKQPDLNWENEKVRQEVYEMMKFWLDKGIDGFRMDVINMISKHPELPDAKATAGKTLASGGPYFMNGPRVHEFLQEMNREVLAHYDMMTVGETPDVDVEDAKLYTGADRHELNMVFQFEHVDLDSGPNGKWDLRPLSLLDLKHVFTKWQNGLDQVGWNSLYLNNHDQPRAVSRYGDDGVYWKESAKMLATFLHMLKGTPYIYQGEEIGMTNVKFPSIDDYKDIETLNMYKDKVVEQGLDHDKVMEAIYAKGRDNARTPMQWNDENHAGFTTGIPWIQVNPNYPKINVAQQLKEEDSIFHYYKKLIQLRKANDVVVYGKYDLLLPESEKVYAYTRTLENEQLLVILNFTASEVPFLLPDEVQFKAQTLLIANYDVPVTASIEKFNLRPYEARVYQLSIS
ncbi:alpha-glucosidase [Virgibacillus soli]|uniref:glycoside hydrolase family 13 protein n=1 Tax=Paracerasibacillus soli TaxID=480284 RepID=UPI0035ED4F70